MADFLIRTGDLLQIDIPPPAIIPELLAPVPLTGSSVDVLIDGLPVCLLGDELPLELLSPLAYTAPPFVTPGTGLVTVELLADNLTILTTDHDPMLIKGGPFLAIFTVIEPAMSDAVVPVPDPLLVKPGTAEFLTTNTTVIAT
jgi:hypothetical protein